MEQKTRGSSARSRASAAYQELFPGDVGKSLRHRTVCAICRLVLFPVALASVPRPDARDAGDAGGRWGGGNDLDDARTGGAGRALVAADAWMRWTVALPPVAAAATWYPAARAQQLAPGGYAVGAARGRWTGWVCAPCAERLTVEEHQVGAQRALARRVATLEQRLRLPGKSHLLPPTSPTVQWPERHRAVRSGRQQVMHSEQAPWMVSLEAYRAVRRELRVCRQSLADLTATLASVDACNDTVLAWPPLHPLHSRTTPMLPPVIIERKDSKQWGRAPRRSVGSRCSLRPCAARHGVEPFSRSGQELLSADVHMSAMPVE